MNNDKNEIWKFKDNTHKEQTNKQKVMERKLF